MDQNRICGPRADLAHWLIDKKIYTRHSDIRDCKVRRPMALRRVQGVLAGFSAQDCAASKVEPVVDQARNRGVIMPDRNTRKFHRCISYLGAIPHESSNGQRTILTSCKLCPRYTSFRFLANPRIGSPIRSPQAPQCLAPTGVARVTSVVSLSTLRSTRQKGAWPDV
jgi:hypothetical protein